MKKHVKIYLKENGYTTADIIICEIPDCGQVAVDIHHIEPRGMGGSKNKDNIENLIALCRSDHDAAESGGLDREYLFMLAQRRINANPCHRPRQ